MGGHLSLHIFLRKLGSGKLPVAALTAALAAAALSAASEPAALAAAPVATSRLAAATIAAAALAQPAAALAQHAAVAQPVASVTQPAAALAAVAFTLATAATFLRQRVEGLSLGLVLQWAHVPLPKSVVVILQDDVPLGRDMHAVLAAAAAVASAQPVAALENA